jgi:DNA sulfur modification protein DndD
MRLHSLTLDNVGVYRGPQTVRFSTLKSKPITLIGGKNGTGKTSLLDSIPLVLYGNRARRILNGVAYPEYLHGLVHHGELAASIRLEFDRTENGRPVRYSVERAWRRTSRGRSADQLSITTDGEVRTDLVAAWPEFVEGIMPMAVADLTIFDGEKIESLADPTSSAEVLRTSLFGLLGLDLVDRLRSDLQNFRRRAARAHDAQASTDLGDRLRHAEQLLAEAREHRDAAAQSLDAAQSARDGLEERLQRATDRLARAGGNLHAQRGALQRQLAESTVAANTVERELLQLSGGDLPLTLVPHLLKQVASAGDQRDRAILAAELSAAMKQRDSRLTESISAALGLDASGAKKLRAVLRADLDLVEQPAPPAFLPTQDAADAARSLIHARSAALRDDARRLVIQLRDHHAEAERIERMLAAVPDADSIAAVVQEVANAEAELRLAEQVHERALVEFSDVERRLELAQRVVDKLAHDILDAGAADANAARVAREVNAADHVLTEFADHMVRKHLGRITREINLAMGRLLRKSGLVTGVKIDPSDLSVTLIDDQDHDIDARRLSAGERQIMATAVLWGLSRCTGMTLPTIIDTPVGRLDRSHRTNLVERYFPNAARQVVLLSTDEEIVGDQLARLLPSVGAQYRLDFNEAEAYTSIVDGYLDE